MSEAVETSYGQLSVMESGEFAGWRYWQGDPFETRSGPFYYRLEEDGSYVSAFRAEPRHMNGGGFMHGGCLLTFAQVMLPRLRRGFAAAFAGLGAQLALQER